MAVELWDSVVNLQLCLAYIVLNSALNFANRWALGVHDFSFPLMLTAAHMLLNPVLLAPMMLMAESYRGKHWGIVSSNFRMLLVIALFNGVQISLNNSSLVHIELSMNQVVRANMPVVCALVELVRGRPPRLAQVPVLVAIALGVMMVVYQDDAKSNHGFGVLLVVSSVLLQAAQMSFAGSALSVKLDSFQMTFYTSPMSMLALAVPSSMVEGVAFTSYFASKPSVTLLILVGTCCLAVVYNVVMFQTIHRLDPIGSSVLGNVKVVVLLVLSKFLMDEMRQWGSRHYIGCVLTFGGAAVYSWQKLKGREPEKKQK